MRRTLLGCLLCGLFCQATFAATPRIVGGTPVTDAPTWMAALQYRLDNGTFSQFCGATLIDSEWVLTAAHCVEWAELNRVNLILDQTTLNHITEGIKVDQLILHPDWLPSWKLSTTDGSRMINEFAGDLALLHLTQPQSAAPVTLATAAQQDTLAPYQSISAIGWGATNSSGDIFPYQLQGISLPYLGKYDSEAPNHIFAGGESGESICFGDSGGPLYLNNVQYGIDSFISSVICGNSGGYSAFTSVADYRGWIMEQLHSLTYTTVQSLSIIAKQTGQASFVIRNNDTQEWTISNLATDGGTLSDDCQSGPLPSGSSCRITITSTAESEGSTQQINVSFDANADSGSQSGQMQLRTTSVAAPGSDTSSSGGGSVGLFGLFALVVAAARRRILALR
jgi:secreted trypsin-like serine protease